MQATDRIAAVRFLITVQRWTGLLKWQDENSHDLWTWVKRIHPFALHLPLTFTYIGLMWLEALTSADFEQAGQVLYMSVTELALVTKLINIWYRREQVAGVHSQTGRRSRLPAMQSRGEGVLAPPADALPAHLLLLYPGQPIALLYRVMNLRLQALHRTPERESAPRLRAIFRLHTRVRRLTRQCEALVSPYVLSQVVFSAFIICFSAYRLVHMGFRERPGLFLTTLQFVAVMIVQIFLPCYYGNELTFHASALTDSVFRTNWLEYSVPTRKLLNCYMEFLKRPVKVRAGVFFEIGLPIFVKTINNAYSFFALLLKVSK
ncbi:GL27119 [Drosophila persimilis]|uniref:GL27119 n=1 Tax=Drosophila persimilis TaxID=7234 RepID=B4GYS3_DROPE|nr:GL27119 [Drosophila persimilis]